MADIGFEICRGHRGCGAPVHGYHADRTFGVHRVCRAVAIGFTFIGRYDKFAIRAEGQHVGLGANGQGVQQVQACGIKKSDFARAGFGVGLYGHSHQAVKHRHAVKDAATKTGGGNALNRFGCGGVGQVHHVQSAIGAIDDKEAFGLAVKRGDFCGPQCAAAKTANLGKGE